jgi:CheY-like chemotaxis protein
MAASVLIVDDHAGFRLSARRILESDGYEIVDGFEVARQLAGQPGAPAIVLTSSHDSEDFGDSLPSSRAAGFVAKDELCGAAVAALVA